MQELIIHNGLGETRGAAVESEGRASLEGLLAEVIGLASQLKKKEAQVTGQESSPSGGGSILRALDRLGPQTVPGIARARGMSRQNIQVLVNRLESEGYVALVPNPAHKRSGLVELTDRGRRSLAALMEQETASLQAMLPHVCRSRLVPATRLLRQLRELLAGRKLPVLATTCKALAPGRGKKIGPDSASRPRKRVRRGTAAGARAELPAPPEGMEPEEGELPVSLL